MPDASARATWDAIERIAATARGPHIADARLVHLPGNVPPWTDTGLHVRRGEWISLLASGRLVLADALDLWLPPRLALWARVGGRGPIVNGTRDTTSLRAEGDGALELALYNGEWASPDGELATPTGAYATSGGAIDVVIRWSGPPADGLAALGRRCRTTRRGAELIASGTSEPLGWRHLWFLGPTECFHADVEDDRPTIARRRERRRHPAEDGRRPARPGDDVAWRWRVDELPPSPPRTRRSRTTTRASRSSSRTADLTWY